MKQGGAIQASGTQKKADNHVEGVVKEAGVFVTWEFDTQQGSKKDLNALPYFIAEMEGNAWKPLVENQTMHKLSKQKIRQKVPFGKEVALFLGNDAKARYRTRPLYRVKAESGFTDIVVKISEIDGPEYDATQETPANPVVSGTKKTFSAKLYGTTWMKFSHVFTVAEAQAATTGESQELQDAVKKIYEGAPVVSGSVISLVVTKPNQQVLKIRWPAEAFENCRANIPSIVNATDAKRDIIVRVNPATYKAFIKAAFELDVQELEIKSGWRPMLGSVLHRLGVGLDVGHVKIAGQNREFRRNPTAADNAYNNLLREKADLLKKKVRTPTEEARLSELKANEASKATAARNAIHAADDAVLRDFTAKLRANAQVKQTFDPWEMDLNTRDNAAATANYLRPGNEYLHRNHLHITIQDNELGY